MKKLTVILPLLFVLCPAFSQVPSSCNKPPELRQAYESDVNKLAVRFVSSESSPYKDSVWIPQFIEDNIWSGLAAIYNAYSLPDRDSIFDVYCIHEESGSPYPPQTLEINIDTGYLWTEHWRNEETLTGYPPLDSFLVRYSFSLANYEDGRAALITSAHLNMTALLDTWADSLKKLNGITDVFLYSGPAGCYNQLLYETKGDTSIYSFVMGWGDTHWDCNNTCTWTFAVHHCAVELISKISTLKVPGPLPAFRKPNCNITSGVRNLSNDTNGDFVLAPNPARDHSKISTTTPGTCQVVLYNILGHRVYHATFSDQITLPLSPLKNGMYFVQILSQDGKRYGYKLVVE